MLPVNILFVRQYLSKSRPFMFLQTLHQMVTACLRLRRLFPLNFTFSVTNLCIVYAVMCVVLYSDVIIHRIYGIRP